MTKVRNFLGFFTLFGRDPVLLHVGVLDKEILVLVVAKERIGYGSYSLGGERGGFSASSRGEFRGCFKHWANLGILEEQRAIKEVLGDQEARAVLGERYESAFLLKLAKRLEKIGLTHRRT